MSDSDRILRAYQIEEKVDCEIVPAPVAREWMDATGERFAYRCLPLVIANQAGWFITCERTFRARWNGGGEANDLEIHFEDHSDVQRICSHFGDGILTFRLPFLFRTPPGINLWVKGPTNWVKDGIQALEGVVETDWSTATFTMNWKLTRPGAEVRFERGEPVCMVVPVPRGLAESLEPRLAPLANEPELRREFESWKASRVDFHRFLSNYDRTGPVSPWQKHYYQGRTVTGFEFPEHQMRLHLKPFVSE